MTETTAGPELAAPAARWLKGDAAFAPYSPHGRKSIGPRILAKAV